MMKLLEKMLAASLHSPVAMEANCRGTQLLFAACTPCLRTRGSTDRGQPQEGRRAEGLPCWAVGSQPRPLEQLQVRASLGQAQHAVAKESALFAQNPGTVEGQVCTLGRTC